jgi:hypothetical protein
MFLFVQTAPAVKVPLPRSLTNLVGAHPTWPCIVRTSLSFADNAAYFPPERFKICRFMMECSGPSIGRKSPLGPGTNMLGVCFTPSRLLSVRSLCLFRPSFAIVRELDRKEPVRTRKSKQTEPEFGAGGEDISETADRLAQPANRSLPLKGKHQQRLLLPRHTREKKM